MPVILAIVYIVIVIGVAGWELEWIAEQLGTDQRGAFFAILGVSAAVFVGFTIGSFLYNRNEAGRPIVEAFAANSQKTAYRHRDLRPLAEEPVTYAYETPTSRAYRLVCSRRRYDFEIKKIGPEWRAYILNIPDYSAAGRNPGAHQTHRLNDGRYYVCPGTTPRTFTEAKEYAQAWTQYTDRYLRTGSTEQLA